MVMKVPESEGEFFARVSDSVFWDNKMCVKVLIELYKEHECLWNVRSPYFKNIAKKKKSKSASFCDVWPVADAEGKWQLLPAKQPFSAVL